MDLFLFHKAVDKYLAGTASPSEQKLVESYWKRFSAEDLNTLTDVDRQRLREAIHAGVYQGIRHAAPVVPFYKRKFFRVAAAVLIICLAAATYYTIFKSGANSETTIIAQNDITPANESATLTLADGRVILLDSSANGAIKGDIGINIVKKDGDVIYSGAGTGGEILFNTLSTARGRNYRSAEQFEKQLITFHQDVLTGESLEYKELKNIIYELINSLPEDQKTIFLLNREEGLTYKQIAEKLNISVKTVEKKMSRSIKELRTGLDEVLMLIVISDAIL